MDPSYTDPRDGSFPRARSVLTCRDEPEQQRAWLRQRHAGAAALAEIEARELRQLDGETALAQSEALLAAAPIAEMVRDRRDTSGFVEQQKLFSLSRRR